MSICVHMYVKGHQGKEKAAGDTTSLAAFCCFIDTTSTSQQPRSDTIQTKGTYSVARSFGWRQR